MDEILHHLRNAGRMIPLQIPTNNGLHVVQDFVHPQNKPGCNSNLRGRSLPLAATQWRSEVDNAPDASGLAKGLEALKAGFGLQAALV